MAFPPEFLREVGERNRIERNDDLRYFCNSLDST